VELQQLIVQLHVSTIVLIELAHEGMEEIVIITFVSRSQTVPSGMPHLTCGTVFLLLFVFLISSILHHRPARLHLHTHPALLVNIT